MTLLKKLWKSGNKSLLEEKVNQIERDSMEPAGVISIINAIKAIEREYKPDNPRVKSGELSRVHSILLMALSNPSWSYSRIYKSGKDGRLYVTLPDSELRYSNWSVPFEALT